MMAPEPFDLTGDLLLHREVAGSDGEVLHLETSLLEQTRLHRLDVVLQRDLLEIRDQRIDPQVPAAELLAGPWRMRINAATHHRSEEQRGECGNEKATDRPREDGCHFLPRSRNPRARIFDSTSDVPRTKCNRTPVGSPVD